MKLSIIVALAALAVANAGSVDLKAQDKEIATATTAQDAEDSFLEAAATGGLKCTCVDKFKRCTDAWCNMNCGHTKKFCPKSYCRCIPSATPPPPPAPYNPDAPGSMCVKEKGTYNKTASDYVCCASTCGTCGGPECGDRPGGRDNCCVNVITANAGNETCDETTPPCIVKATTQAVKVAPTWIKDNTCGVVTAFKCAEAVKPCVAQCKQGVEACVKCLGGDFDTCCPCLEKIPEIGKHIPCKNATTIDKEEPAAEVLQIDH